MFICRFRELCLAFREGGPKTKKERDDYHALILLIQVPNYFLLLA